LLHDRHTKRLFDAGWSSPVARQAHNLKVIGSNPIPATKFAAKSMTYVIGLAALSFSYPQPAAIASL
jgi:hypothetical protein